MSAPNEFEQIARLYRPLTRGAPEALGLLDDAAVMASRPGFDLVITKDTLVEGVHFPAGERPDLVARKLLRVNLSDLAAKGADPYGYLLSTAWPPGYGWAERESFARGLDIDGEAFGLTLLGGDTVSTSGPLVVSATMLGWVPAGGMVRRAGAQDGDVLAVSGVIGDGGLGLKVVQNALDDPHGRLRARYTLPEPRVDLRDGLRQHAHAAADVSDGLVADAWHIAEASRLGLVISLGTLPVSPEGRTWLAQQSDPLAAMLFLATSGDDYEVVCATSLEGAAAMGMTVIGHFGGDGLVVLSDGKPVETGPGGWQHR